MLMVRVVHQIFSRAVTGNQVSELAGALAICTCVREESKKERHGFNLRRGQEDEHRLLWDRRSSAARDRALVTAARACARNLGTSVLERLLYSVRFRGTEYRRLRGQAGWAARRSDLSSNAQNKSAGPAASLLHLSILRFLRCSTLFWL